MASLTCTVGSILGFGATNSVTKVCFNKNIYDAGETVKLHIECDNT